VEIKRCVTCGQTGTVKVVREEFIDEFHLADGTVIKFAFEDFPQQACSNCGERYYGGPALTAAENAMTREIVARQIRDPAVFRWLRKTAHLKATELAELLGVTPETISHWENGHTEPSRAVWAILDALAEDEIEGRTTTLDRLRAPTERTIPKRPVHLSLKAAG
jgi:DNA-binding transcriptional regulator YiaG